jgi:hypothetical protein
MDCLNADEPFPLATRLMPCALLSLMMSGLTINLESFRGPRMILGMMETHRRFCGTYGMSLSKTGRVRYESLERCEVG